MNTDNCRIIHTKLYSKIANEVLQSVEGQLSDGMWENSPAMEKYWRFSNIETAPNGEVLIKISKEYSERTGVPSGYPQRGWPKWTHNGFYDMSDADIIKWFAGKIKHIMQAEFKDNDIVSSWKRDNDTFKTQYLSYKEKITVTDVYFIYDFLMDRNITKYYGNDMSTKIIAAPKSKADTEAEEKKRAAIAKLNEEWVEVRQRLDIEKRMKITDAETEFNDKIKIINAEFQKKLNDIYNDFKEAV